ncbi:MAG: RHS repeat protein, partial [Okeania sp. SIO2H7]|nr:RHS repeat protein [Okeania sp. SIO2H7]
ATYDEVGNMTTSTDLNKEVTTYTYDALDRLTVKYYEDDTDVGVIEGLLSPSAIR